MNDPHPFYGPCDGFGPNGKCAECKRSELVAKAEKDWHEWMQSESSEKNKMKVSYTAEARRILFEGKTVVGAWTDGSMISSEYESGMHCVLRLKEGEVYEITVEVKER